MRTIEVKVYQFDELSDSAKEKARNWYRQGTIGDNFYSESVIEDLLQIAPLLGIDIALHLVQLGKGKSRQEPSIWWSGFSTQGDGACFEGTWRASGVQPGKLKEFAPRDEELHRVATEIEKVAAADPTMTTSLVHRDRYYHKYSVDIDSKTESEEMPEADFLANHETAKEALRDLMQWLYDSLEREYDTTQADEQVDESIRCNEYEFDEDGDRFTL